MHVKERHGVQNGVPEIVQILAWSFKKRERAVIGQPYLPPL